jgi:mRNA interferase MazF
VGVNIGHEMDGKNQFYNRPVLIVRKFNPHIFFGVPLTTKIKQNPYYLPIRFKDREQCVMLSQLRLWDGKRLTHKMGQLPDDQFEAVKQALRRLLK